MLSGLSDFVKNVVSEDGGSVQKMKRLIGSTGAKLTPVLGANFFSDLDKAIKGNPQYEAKTVWQHYAKSLSIGVDKALLEKKMDAFGHAVQNYENKQWSDPVKYLFGKRLIDIRNSFDPKWQALLDKGVIPSSPNRSEASQLWSDSIFRRWAQIRGNMAYQYIDTDKVSKMTPQEAQKYVSAVFRKASKYATQYVGAMWQKGVDEKQVLGQLDEFITKNLKEEVVR